MIVAGTQSVVMTVGFVAFRTRSRLRTMNLEGYPLITCTILYLNVLNTLHHIALGSLYDRTPTYCVKIPKRLWEALAKLSIESENMA